MIQQKALRCEPQGFFAFYALSLAASSLVSTPTPSDGDTLVSLFEHVANVQQLSFSRHATTPPCFDFIGRNHIEAEEVIHILGLADLEKDRIFVSIQAEVAPVVFASEVGPDFRINEAPVDVVDQLLGKSIPIRAEVAFFLGFWVDDQFPVFLAVGEAVKTECEFDADLAGSQLECAHRGLQVSHADFFSIDRQIIPAHVHGHFFSAHENMRIKGDVNMVAIWCCAP